MKDLVAEIESKRARAKEMGGPEKVTKQHAKGKLTARERIDLLLDPGSFVEFGILAEPYPELKVLPGRDVRGAADGVVTGYGKIEGRRVGVAAYDFTVLGGSIGVTGETKVTRLREMTLKWRMPIIWLCDSAGARIHESGGGHEQASLFAGMGYLFREQVVMSGVVPQVCAMVGPGAAGTAYLPGLADFVPMVKGTSSMALGGRYLVKAAIGEDVTEEEMGGSKVHCELSGVGDLEVENDEACMKVIRDYLSYFPSFCDEVPPVVPCDDPVDRREEGLLTIVPENPRRAYDMKRLIGMIADHGKYFEMKPKWARSLVTCLARFGGRPAGIVANNPMYFGGVLDNDSADKAARFVGLCDAFRIPLVFLVDVPGFMVGSKVEKEGIIRHGSKMLHAVASATVPKITIVIRKAYGAGYFVMNGRAYEPDYIAAWPTAEIALMGPEGFVSIFARKGLEASDNPEAMKQALIEEIKKNIHPFLPARQAMIDDVIDPRETRLAIARMLELAWDKQIERPPKRHGVFPV
ncbi:MAG: acyl-CoA carboxylase subunit beta [Nitrospirae bacterium]|nr:acyl-CoA carboxylase subunit beta [Nitrospirota bacterium]